MTPIRILIADDHALVRQAVRRILETNPEWEVVAEAVNGREAVELAECLQPEIAVLDLGMPELNGLEAIRLIVEKLPQVRILVLSIHESESVIHDALAAGAHGYLGKSDAGRDLVTAVQALADGRPFLTAKASQALLNHILHSSTPKRAEERSPLTPREREIVRLVAQRMTNRQIASLLNISVRTVETHRSHIMEKLSIRSVSGLILYASRHGLHEPLPLGRSPITP